MRATDVMCPRWMPAIGRIARAGCFSLAIVMCMAGVGLAANLKVMATGLGSGTITSSPAGISCGPDCDESIPLPVTVALTATPAAGSTFSHWEGDASGTASTVTVNMIADRTVRAVFDLAPAIPPLTDFTPAGIQNYLAANPIVTTAARFLKALPIEFTWNWILMSRSESLQGGTAEYPRVLLPSANAQAVFTVALTAHASYPGAHPNAVEYMQWDAAEKNFRFHEIVLDAVPAMANFPARSRGVSIDDAKCSKCHSTRNVLNRSTFPGTTGITPGLFKAKNKPNWDTYDSWAGMMPFNRDRIYQGSVEAAAFRKLLNPWTWRSDASARSFIEQLQLQPPGIPTTHAISRTSGGVNDGHVDFAFDASTPTPIEPTPAGSGTITTSYSFDGVAGTGTSTPVQRGGQFLTLHHSSIATSDEGRGVHFFDLLGGAAGNLNAQRIADELIDHRFATGSFPIDVRPIAMAITKGGLLAIAGTSVQSSVSGSPLTINLGFFDARNGMTIDQLVADTEVRSHNLTRRKADIQKLNLDRTGDVYLSPSGPANGLIQQYGAATADAMSTALSRLRQEVFRRPIDAGAADQTVMGGIYVDRELPSNIQRMALYRYFLEPLGVSVDKWSMGIRGRSRTYTFADVLGTYLNRLEQELRTSLANDPVPGLSNPDDDAQLIAAVNGTLASLPGNVDVPTFTDLQRIFNKSCIECHGGLRYPPYGNYSPTGYLDLSEDENPPATMPPPCSPRLARSNDRVMSYTTSDPMTSFMYDRVTRTTEDCPNGLMPCGGPALSKVDIETLRRWIAGSPSRPFTCGDPHMRTVDGVNYDFQGVGEFVLLRDEFMELQARQTAVETSGPVGPDAHTGLTSCVSINTAVAVRVGSDRITYQPYVTGWRDTSGLQLRVNAKLVRLDKNGIALESGGRIMQTIASGGIQIEAPGGAVIVVTPGYWDAYKVWYLNVDAHHIRATQGLMGHILPGNWLPALPDGRSLGPKPAGLPDRYAQLYTVFGDAWRVTNTTSLFDYAPGTSTATHTLKGWPDRDSSQPCVLPPGQGTGQPPAKALAEEVAMRCCGGIVDGDRKANCVKDVMATGDTAFARTYRLADQIARNRAPTAPVLLSPDGYKTGLDARVSFTWRRSTDPDGDPVTYRHYVWPVADRPNNNDAEPVAVRLVSNAVILVAVLAAVLLAALIIMRKRPRTLLAAAIVAIVAVALAYYFGGSTTRSRTIQLRAGRAYFWKVIAEDGKGGTTESETRRFEIK